MQESKLTRSVRRDKRRQFLKSILIGMLKHKCLESINPVPLIEVSIGKEESFQNTFVNLEDPENAQNLVNTYNKVKKTKERVLFGEPHVNKTRQIEVENEIESSIDKTEILKIEDPQITIQPLIQQQEIMMSEGNCSLEITSPLLAKRREPFDAIEIDLETEVKIKTPLKHSERFPPQSPPNIKKFERYLKHMKKQINEMAKELPKQPNAEKGEYVMKKNAIMSISSRY